MQARGQLVLSGREQAWCWRDGRQTLGWSRERGRWGRAPPPAEGRDHTLWTGKRVSHGGLGSMSTAPSLPQEQGSFVLLDTQPPTMPTASSHLPCS